MGTKCLFAQIVAVLVVASFHQWKGDSLANRLERTNALYTTTRNDQDATQQSRYVIGSGNFIHPRIKYPQQPSDVDTPGLYKYLDSRTNISQIRSESDEVWRAESPRKQMTSYRFQMFPNSTNEKLGWNFHQISGKSNRLCSFPDKAWTRLIVESIFRRAQRLICRSEENILEKGSRNAYRMVEYKYSFLEPHEVNHTQCYFEEMFSDKGKLRKGKMKPFVYFERNFIYLAKLEKEYSRLICLAFYERFTSKCDLSFDDDKNEVEVALWDSGEEFTCTNNDEEFTNCTNGSPVITLGDDGVCTVQGLSKVIEEKFHVQFTIKKKILPREGDLKPSVIVLALHRVSRLNFMRRLPKSFSFINNTSGMFVFEKHARTGGDWTENFVNLISGRKTPLHDGKHNRKPDLYKGSLFDMFSKLNYVVAGDYPLGDSKPFRHLGFPEDVFPNSLATFWDWVEENTQNISNPQCLGSRHRVEYEVDYLLSIVNSMSRFPYFYFNVLSNLTHSNLNNAQILDDALYRFLNDAFAFGKLDRTFLFLLSEEGFPVEEASRDFEDEALEQLKAEARAPFLALHTPPHFEDFLPKLKDTLRHNQRQMTTHFDVFESIRDLVLLHAQEDPGSLRSWSSPPQGSFGQSLWKALPFERSCETMGVEDINCPCKL